MPIGTGRPCDLRQRFHKPFGGRAVPRIGGKWSPPPLLLLNPALSPAGSSRSTASQLGGRAAGVCVLFKAPFRGRPSLARLGAANPRRWHRRNRRPSACRRRRRDRVHQDQCGCCHPIDDAMPRFSVSRFGCRCARRSTTPTSETKVANLRRCASDARNAANAGSRGRLTDARNGTSPIAFGVRHVHAQIVAVPS